MKVSELIEKLKEMPPDAEVWHLYDGEAGTQIEFVWLARNGDVITADFDEPIYSTEIRPVGAPTREEDRYFRIEQFPVKL